MPNQKRLLPDLDADWRIVRRLNEAITECVGHAIESLAETDANVAEAMAAENEEALELLEDRLLFLAVTGKEPPTDA